jgi:hypothetical protein
MRIVKHLEVKVLGITATKVRPSANAVSAMAAKAIKDKAPPPTGLGDGYQLSIGTTDENGRVTNRKIVTLCDGMLSVGSTDLGEAPASFQSALEGFLKASDDLANTLITSNKIVF